MRFAILAPMHFALLILLFASIAPAHAQESQTDIPETESHYYSKKSIRDAIEASEDFKQAKKNGLNIYIEYDYDVTPIKGASAPVRHHYTETVQEPNLTADMFTLYFSGRFMSNGGLVTSMVITSNRSPPTAEMLAREAARIKAEKERLERERIAREEAEKKRIQDEKDRAEHDRLAREEAEKQAKLKAEQDAREAERLKKEADEREAAKKAAEAAERERIAALYKKAKAELDKARAELNPNLVFPVPLEPYVAFILDGTSSISENDSVSGINFMELARKHLSTTLSLLIPTQRFVVAMTGEPRDLFNHGEPMYATEENIAAAQAWLDNIRPNSDQENFDLTLKDILAVNAERPDRIMIFTDGGVGDPRDVTGDFLAQLNGYKTVVDIAPIANSDFQSLKAKNYEGSDNNMNFIRDATAKTHGTILREIHALPDAAQVQQYKDVLAKVLEMTASKEKAKQQPKQKSTKLPAGKTKSLPKKPKRN